MSPWCRVFKMLFSFSVASFAIPGMVTVAENASTLVCVQMIATPAVADLTDEVTVRLSSIDGTGKI